MTHALPYTAHTCALLFLYPELSCIPNKRVCVFCVTCVSCLQIVGFTVAEDALIEEFPPAPVAESRTEMSDGEFVLDDQTDAFQGNVGDYGVGVEEVSASTHTHTHTHV